MNCLIVTVAVLFAIIQTAPPVPPKVAHKSGTHSGLDKKSTKGEKGQAPSTSISVIKPNNTPPDEPKTNPTAPSDTQKTINVRELPTVTVYTDWWFRFYVIFTGLLVVVGGLGVYYAIQTLQGIKRQAKANEDQLTEIRESAEKTDRMILIAAQEAENGKISADAAKKSAEAAQASANAARESIMLTHRPKIVVRSVVAAWNYIIMRRTTVEQLNKSEFDDGQLGGALYLVNIGNQPATVVSLEQYLSFDEYLPLERPYESGANQKVLNIQLKPGQACKLPFRPTAVTAGESQKIIGGPPMCAIGRVLYVDELGNRRETGFARRFMPNQQRFVAMDDPDYEYAD